MKVEIFHEPLTIVMVHDFFSCEERLFLIDFFKHNDKNFFRAVLFHLKLKTRKYIMQEKITKIFGYMKTRTAFKTVATLLI